MNEMYWVAFVGCFLLPFCSVCFLIYLEERKQRAISSLLLQVVIAQIVPNEDKVPNASVPSLEEIEARDNKHDPDAPPYLEPAHNTVLEPLYRDKHAASAARMQMPRIYIHAVGLR
jgi:hypothetical protein